MGRTAQHAELLFSAYAEVRELDIEAAYTGTEFSLCVQHPFSVLIAIRAKTIELRKSALPVNRKGKQIFISEATTKSKFSPSARALVLSKGFTRNGKIIVGSVVTLSSSPLSKHQLTRERAEAACLTVEGLRKAWRDGYTHEWHLEAACSFVDGPEKASMHATKHYCVIRTATHERPRKRLATPSEVAELALDNKPLIGWP
jgi:hypothetical protein